VRFGEIERPTTNQIPSLLRSWPEDFTCQTSKYESDVFLSQPALAQLQTGMSPGPSLNRDSIGQTNRAGMREGKRKLSTIAPQKIQLITKILNY
jgi:hypothetical protein